MKPVLYERRLFCNRDHRASRRLLGILMLCGFAWCGWQFSAQSGAGGEPVESRLAFAPHGFGAHLADKAAPDPAGISPGKATSAPLLAIADVRSNDSARDRTPVTHGELPGHSSSPESSRPAEAVNAVRSDSKVPSPAATTRGRANDRTEGVVTAALKVVKSTPQPRAGKPSNAPPRSRGLRKSPARDKRAPQSAYGHLPKWANKALFKGSN